MYRLLGAGFFAMLFATTALGRVTPFPAAFHPQMVQTNGTSLYVRVGGERDPLSCCYTASATRATCGRRWRPSWSKTTPS